MGPAGPKGKRPMALCNNDSGLRKKNVPRVAHFRVQLGKLKQKPVKPSCSAAEKPSAHLQERLRAVVKEVSESRRRVILVVDEVHLFVFWGGGL